VPLRSSLRVVHRFASRTLILSPVTDDALQGGGASLSTSPRASPGLASQQGDSRRVALLRGQAWPGRSGQEMWTAVGRAAQRYRNAIAFSGMCTHPCEPSVLYFGLPYANFCQDESWNPNNGASNGIQYFTA